MQFNPDTDKEFDEELPPEETEESNEPSFDPTEEDIEELGEFDGDEFLAVEEEESGFGYF